MSFSLVHYSQQDPQWKGNRLGFGDPGDTIGYVGCALTATAMLLSGHGYTETPKTLNTKLKSVGGFVGAAIAWGAVSQIHPNVTLKAFIPCSTSDAPLAQIDASISAGQPVIVQVDSSPAAGIQTHWVVLYARSGEDYLMLDPWPYPSVTDPDSLMKRYAQGRKLKRAISHVIIYEVYGSGGPVTDSGTTSGPAARVKDIVTLGLNIRSNINTSDSSNIVTTVPAGTQLLLLDADDPSKVGAVNQWVHVRTPDGKEGFAAAWYLELIAQEAPGTSTSTSAESSSPETPSTGETPVPVNETPANGIQVRVRGIISFLRIRSSKDVTSDANVVTTVAAGTTLTLVDASEEAKIGEANQWVRVRDANGNEGLSVAWFIEKVDSQTPVEEMNPAKKYLVVSDAAGEAGTILRKTASNRGEVQMNLMPGMLLIVIEPYAKAKSKLGQQNQWIYVRGPGGPEKKLGYVLSQFVKLP